MAEVGASRSDVAGGGSLARLLETEARLAAAVAAAEAEGAHLVQAARDAAAAQEASHRQRVEQDASALARRVAAQRDAEIARLTGAAETRSRRLEALPPGLIEELAAELAARLLRPDDQGLRP